MTPIKLNNKDEINMYHFVKFNNTWYLKPESVQDIIDHFTKICGREFQQGFDDFKDNVRVSTDYNGEKYLYSRNHSSSVWRNAVELTMQMKDLSWLEGASVLEKQTYHDRIKMFNKGRAIYFTDGLPYYCSLEHPEYDKEHFEEKLIYPYEYNFEDVRFIQWEGGRHWYAKIGSIDIVDKYGNQKWNDKYYAMEIAKKWCKCGGDWNKIEL